jgi:hypothetical protein
MSHAFDKVRSSGLERFKNYCSHSASWTEGAFFLGFGLVLAQSQAAAGMLLRQSLAKTQKSSLRMATVFLKTLYQSAIQPINNRRYNTCPQ